MAEEDMKVTTAYTLELDKGTREEELPYCLVKGDRNAHRIMVCLTRHGKPLDLANATITLYVVQSIDTVRIEGRVLKDGICVAELDDVSYSETGSVSLLFEIVYGEVIYTPLVLRTVVLSSVTDSMVDKSGKIPSITELLARIEDMKQYTAAMGELEGAIRSAESDREHKETERTQRETARVKAEAERALNEAGRANAEVERDKAEAARANAEDARANDERLRQQAEATRHTESAKAVQAANVAADRANGVAERVGSLRPPNIYSGTAITGASKIPTAYETGIGSVIAGDRYVYNGIGEDDIGNEYVCVTPGDAATALWIYDRNTRGSKGAGSVSFVCGVEPVEGDVKLNATDVGALPDTLGPVTEESILVLFTED